jgi:hypothetical protein
MHVWVSNYKEIIMATVNKDFKVKHGLIVEGTNATVDGSDIITEDALVGGTQTNVTVTYDAENKVVNFVAESGLGDGDTDDLAEGTTNLYYTESRAKTDAAELLVAATKTNITITGDGTGLTITAENGVADSDTDDLDEGSTNLYYTESRAKTDAAELLTGATLTNISITGNGSGLTITAENGVADSNTDALAEGTTNKYFTDERAQDAVGNAVGTGLTYNDTSGAISVTTNTYDAYGSASAVAGDLTTHTSATEAHGATGAVVGTTNTQTLTNKTLTSPKINEDVALTATATELNVLDGITASTAELNTLDGITATVAELNILDGVTSSAAELNILDGATLTTTELNYVDGVTSSIQTQLDGKLDESGGTMTGNLAMGTNRITGLGAPDQSTDAATKAYVDAAVEGLHVHEAARVAVQGNISIATGLENGDTAGGVTLATGNRVLLKDQTNAAENGIYVVQVSGQALRATDFDTAMEVDSGDFVFVSEGTYANTGWVQTLKPATIGTDPLQFTQFSGAGTYTAGNGLTLDGTVFEIDDTITATKTYVDTNFVNVVDLPGELDDYVLLTQKGANDGVATLDSTGQVPLTQLENVTDVIDALTTTDIAEGTSLYFTDTRAVDALEAVVPNFTAVEVNSLAKQVAATSSSLGSVVVTAYSFPKATYRTAKFIVKIDNGTHNEVTEVLLSLDSSDNIAITEYAIVGTNGSRGTITADISGASVRLRVDPVNDSTINVVGTLLA